MNISTLYLYDEIFGLLYLPDMGYYDHRMDNAPMNKRPIKAHKGIDNTLRFRVFNPDKKPASICDKLIYVRIIDQDNKRIRLERKVTQSHIDGFFDLMLRKDDLAILDAGLYTMVFLEASEFSKSITGNYQYSGIFTDFDHNIKMTLEVTEQAQHDPIPTYTIPSDQFIHTREYDSINSVPYDKYTSDAIMGTRLNNSISNDITFSTKSSEFYGRLYIYATLEHNPNPDIRRGWSKVEMEDGVDFLRYDGFTGCQYFNLSGNYMWLKFVIIPDEPSTIENFIELSVRT